MTESGNIFELEDKICNHCQVSYVEASSTELPMNLHPDISDDFVFICNNGTIEFNLSVECAKDNLLCVKVSKISKKRRVKRV